MRFSVSAMFTAAVVLVAGAPVSAGRYEAFTQKAAQGEKLKASAATYLGSAGIEEFVAVGELPDGSIVAMGNAWGPDFVTQPVPVVVGRGQHRKLNPYGKPDKHGHKPLSDENPDTAGMIVIFDRAIQKVQSVVRFDWGLANISAGIVAGDGRWIYIAGRSTAEFRALARAARVCKSEPQPTETGRRAVIGPYKYESVQCTGDVYIARIDAQSGKLDWVHIFEGHRTPPDQLWLDARGSVYGNAKGMRRISADGQKQDKTAPLSGSGQARYLCVDPKDGGSFFGGDRNTSTGHQPYRQPYFYKFDKAGQKLFKYWEWPPRDCACGGNGNGLCSDSAPRAMDFAPNGDYVISGWSDGGNTVFTRQPTDVKEGLPRGISGFGMEGSGMKGANSLSHIMRIDPATGKMRGYDLWVCYLPMTFEMERARGAPNHASIKRLVVLDDGAVAITGGAATGLIQTPNAFYKYPDDGRKVGGSYVAVFSADFKTLLFSSYLPGCEEPALAKCKGGVVVVSRSRGTDGAEKGPTPSPTIRPIQKDLRGDFDGHLILLEK